MDATFVIIAELLVFLACGIVLGLCRVSSKVISVAVLVIFIKGIIWDAHFLGGVYTVSLVVTSLSVVYFVSGWALYRERGRVRKTCCAFKTRGDWQRKDEGMSAHEVLQQVQRRNRVVQPKKEVLT